ncbi:GATA zinc finger domain-containing protein 14-like [Teleopsis dalmanni]|uniref:GATA zinc finger domain-containing protein 14-like n=1 Tax=Teleopsis dalmanni TaxID=139649 RepID=UPI0018CDF7B4|nr:GATA zinc finger domain-containing protein 14-like [Teleopsis dalmanni]
MANVMNSNDNNGSGGLVGVNVTGNLRNNACNYIQPSTQNSAASQYMNYDHIIDMIRGLNLQDDGIAMNHKIKSIETDFCNIVHDEEQLCESMEYINDKALADGETALKFALLFSSRNFDALAMKETKVRSAMLKILEANYINADTYRIQDRNRLYNSITLLGEYYHRVRLADNTPISILGESLLGLMIREISGLDNISVKLAKVILSQITLNGDIMRIRHKPELTQLLYHIRRNVIEQQSLKSAVKALLLMTLDLYYSNFTNLGAQLEELYTKFLVTEHDDEDNNNFNALSQQHQSYDPNVQQSQNMLPAEQHIQNNVYSNGDDEALVNDSYENEPSTKKWSEQVCEDSLWEVESNKCSNPQNRSGGADELAVDSLQQNELNVSGNSNDNERSISQSSKRSFKTGTRPRPLHNTEHSVMDKNVESHQHKESSGGEERDQSKPLPRWRTPRFNRDNTEQQNGYHRHQQRRLSGSFDDDHNSVRSDGGNIRLYSVNDRLKHSQEKFERRIGNQHNSIANSNWDRQSQYDDRSERSYMSNYERGNNNNRRGGRNYGNRQTYDKPPRFLKHQQKEQYNNYNKDDKILSESWRRSDMYHNNPHHDNNYESNSRSSSRARTLPRPAKTNMDDTNNSYRRSISPTQNQYRRGRNTRNRHNSNQRYSSQSSLVSDASSTLERHYRDRHNQQHKQYAQNEDWNDKDNSNWDTKENNSEELVRNARQTTDYMKYLSSKK